MRTSSRHLQILKSMEERAPAAKVWAEQWGDLKIMWSSGTPVEVIGENLGRSVSAVLTQATRLGLPRRQSPGRKAKAKAAAPRQTNVIMFKIRHDAATADVMPPRHEKRERNCLMCSASFNSHGSHNRICRKCKTGAAYQIGHDECYKIMAG
jgi:hypothetical protein